MYIFYPFTLLLPEFFFTCEGNTSSLKLVRVKCTFLICKHQDLQLIWNTKTHFLLAVNTATTLYYFSPNTSYLKKRKKKKKRQLVNLRSRHDK